MRRNMLVLSGFVLAIGLSSLDLDDPPGRVAAGAQVPTTKEAAVEKKAEAKVEAKAKAKAEKPKAARAKAGAKKKADSGLGDLLDAAAQELRNVAVKVENVVPNEVQIRQIEQQYTSHFRQMFLTELHFMRLACEPTKAEFEKIAKETAPAARASARRYAMRMNDMNQGRVVFRNGVNQADDAMAEPRKPIIESIGKSVKATLSPEQVARYQKELDLRTAARKRLVRLNLIAKIDSQVILTAEQREKLGEVLDKNWNPSWNNMQMLMYGGQQLPPMPEGKILPILNKTQAATWRAMPKGGIHFGWGDPGMVQGVDLSEEVWKDPNEKPAPEQPEHLGGAMRKR